MFKKESIFVVPTWKEKGELCICNNIFKNIKEYCH